MKRQKSSKTFLYTHKKIRGDIFTIFLRFQCTEDFFNKHALNYMHTPSHNELKSLISYNCPFAATETHFLVTDLCFS